MQLTVRIAPKNYDENCNIGCILEVDTKYPEHFGNSHNDLFHFPQKEYEQTRKSCLKFK